VHATLLNFSWSAQAYTKPQLCSILHVHALCRNCDSTRMNFSRTIYNAKCIGMSAHFTWKWDYSRSRVCTYSVCFRLRLWTVYFEIGGALLWAYLFPGTYSASGITNWATKQTWLGCFYRIGSFSLSTLINSLWQIYRVCGIIIVNASFKTYRRILYAWILMTHRPNYGMTNKIFVKNVQFSIERRKNSANRLT